jgi:hypothetical protein
VLSLHLLRDAGPSLANGNHSNKHPAAAIVPVDAEMFRGTSRKTGKDETLLPACGGMR